jgi:hypothetical protein
MDNDNYEDAFSFLNILKDKRLMFMEDKYRDLIETYGLDKMKRAFEKYCSYDKAVNNPESYYLTILKNLPEETKEKKYIPPAWQRNETRVRYLLRKQREGETSTGTLTKDEWYELGEYIPLTKNVLEQCPSTTITNEQLEGMVGKFKHDIGNIGKRI